MYGDVMFNSHGWRAATLAHGERSSWDRDGMVLEFLPLFPHPPVHVLREASERPQEKDHAGEKLHQRVADAGLNVPPSHRQHDDMMDHGTRRCAAWGLGGRE